MRDSAQGCKSSGSGFGLHVSPWRAGSAAAYADGSLTVRDTAVERTCGFGVRVQSATAAVSRSVVLGTSSPAQVSGDGLVVVGSEPGKPAKITLTDTLTAGSTRAGLLLESALGEIRRCVFRKGERSVVLQRGSSATITDDVHEQNTFNTVARDTNLSVKLLLALPAAPAPPPPLP